ncbi:MAG: ChbG/HpnK family deacetylase [Chloroflexi bacterium]|nr:ChbG/HpnK family deacetylase [Chloroflexota bacterium]
MLDNLRYLIVNADDLGYTPGVTEGIIRAHNAGIVTSTSVMVNMPDAANAVARAADEAPRLGLGLHLNLTAGTPVSDGQGLPDFAANGTFLPRHTLMKRIDAVRGEQARTEFFAQAERFVTLAGKAPDHLDSHHHVTYLSAALFEAMMAVADDLDVPIRRPYPQQREQGARVIKNMGAAATDADAFTRWDALQAVFAAHDYRCPDHVNMAYYGPRTILGDLLNHLVETKDGVTELMCHPGVNDEQLQQMSGYTRYREQELAALTHRSARELLTAEGIVLITFGQLADVSG